MCWMKSFAILEAFIEIWNRWTVTVNKYYWIVKKLIFNNWIWLIMFSIEKQVFEFVMVVMRKNIKNIQICI